MNENENDLQLDELDLESIMKEFSDPADGPAPEAQPEEPVPAEPEDTGDVPAETPADEPEQAAGGAGAEDTGEAGAEDAEAEQTPVPEETVRIGDFSDIPSSSGAAEAPQEEAEDSAPEKSGDDGLEEVFIPSAPIPFKPHSRLQELKRKLIAGPEKRYYELSELGLGRLQTAIILALAVAVMSAASGLLYSLELIPPSRMRFLIFGQFLSVLVAGLLGCQLMIDGVADLFHGKFTLNTLLFFTFLACCADGALCLLYVRVPLCAAFSLEVAMALWSAYHRRSTEIGQMDTMRKATRLDSVVKKDNFYDDRPGLLRGQGEVEDFMEQYDQISRPQRIQNIYALAALLGSLAVAVVAAVFHGFDLGVQIFSATLLVAVPAGTFISLTRPMSILERKLHTFGTVLCGWRGVLGLCGKACFPLRDEDLFPAGSYKMNGVKFYGSRDPDEVVAYAAALIKANGAGPVQLFGQLLESRSGPAYEVQNLVHYGNGGIGGEVEEEPVLVGTQDFLQAMGVEIPDGTMVSQAVYVAIDGELSGLFAVTYARMKSADTGLSALCSNRKLTPVLLSRDFMLTESFLKAKFKVSTRRIAFPDQEVREELAAVKAEEDAPALALTTRDGLSCPAIAVNGAKAVRGACDAGLVIHLAAGIIGLLIMLALAILGNSQLLNPFNIVLYQLIWLVPGFLATEWTRTL